jgi:hypothetical protein
VDAWNRLASATCKLTGLPASSLCQLGRTSVCDASFTALFDMLSYTWAISVAPSGLRLEPSGENEETPQSGGKRWGSIGDGSLVV